MIGYLDNGGINLIKYDKQNDIYLIHNGIKYTWIKYVHFLDRHIEKIEKYNHYSAYNEKLFKIRHYPNSVKDDRDRFCIADCYGSRWYIYDSK